MRGSAARETSDFRIFKIVITGFNTDIEHDGVVYHVQTEDKGLDSPLILSLVYSGGAILASKRSRYEDLIAEGFNEEVLTQRLKRQHRLICAAINAGRLEELKRMGAKPEVEVTETAAPVTSAPEVSEVNAADATAATETETAPEATAAADAPSVDESSAVISALSYETVPSKQRGSSHPPESAYSVHDPRRQAPVSEVRAVESGFALSILDEDEFRAGESYTIRVLVEDRSGNKQKPLTGVGVSVKIVGTAFRPQIYSIKTERDGVAVISTTMPSFTSGRAAVLVRAVVKGEPMEVRRVIHPAE